MADIERPALEREAAALADEGIDVLHGDHRHVDRGRRRGARRGDARAFRRRPPRVQQRRRRQPRAQGRRPAAARLRVGDRRQPVGRHQRHARLPPPPRSRRTRATSSTPRRCRACTTIRGWARTTPPRRRCVALSETLRFELDDDGSNVGVSVLCPSWVRTNITTAVRNLPERLHYELTPAQAEEMARVQVEAPPAAPRRGDRRRRGRRSRSATPCSPTAST